MKQLTQEMTIEEMLVDYLNQGNKSIIPFYNMMEKEHGIPRPTIRKFCHEYKLRLMYHLDVLNAPSKFERKGIPNRKSKTS